MASLSNDLTMVDAMDATTGWSLTGTGTVQALGGPRREGTNLVKITSTLSGAQTIYIEKTTFSFNLTNECLVLWLSPSEGRVLPSWDDWWIRIGSSSTDWKEWRVDGRTDRRELYANWYSYVIDPTSTATSSNGTLNIAAVDRLRISGYDNDSKSNPGIFIDYIKRGAPRMTIDTTGLVEGTAYDFTDLVDDDETSDAGIISQSILMSAFALGGVLTITGTGWFKDVNKALTMTDNTRVNQVDGGQIFEVTAGAIVQLGELTAGVGVSGCLLKSQATQRWAFIVNHASADVRLYGCSLGVLSAFTVTAGKITMTDTLISDCTTIDLNSSTDDLDRATFLTCGEITPNGAQMDDCNFIAGSATYGMIIDVAADIVNVTNPAFTNNNRAIKITAAGTYELDNHSYSGNTYDIETTHSSGLVTINVNNGGDVPTVNNTGGGTYIVNNNVSLTITVKDTSGSAIVSARVLLEADSGGAAPHDESVTITRSASTATVTHTAHGLVTGNMVVIRGANQPEYNGVFTITYISVNSYSYTVSGAPATPATGTITGTQGFMSELTVGGGIATEQFNYAADQPYTGVVRKGSASPYYRDASFSGSITSVGIDIPVQLEND